jgi:hypothetical protein
MDLTGCQDFLQASRYAPEHHPAELFDIAKSLMKKM